MRSIFLTTVLAAGLCLAPSLAHAESKEAPAAKVAATPAPAASAAPSKPVAAPAAKDSKKKLTPQQQKMKDCNAEAKTKALKGAERKAFMKECLSAKPK